jgi:hypothetical protein
LVALALPVVPPTPNDTPLTLPSATDLTTGGLASVNTAPIPVGTPPAPGVDPLTLGTNPCRRTRSGYRRPRRSPGWRPAPPRCPIRLPARRTDRYEYRASLVFLCPTAPMGCTVLLISGDPPNDGAHYFAQRLGRRVWHRLSPAQIPASKPITYPPRAGCGLRESERRYGRSDPGRTNRSNRPRRRH